LKKIIKSHGLLVAIAILIIALDQILKAIVRSNLNFGESWSPFSGFLKSFIRVVHWENYGAAFGLFQGGGVVFGLLAAVVSLVIIIFYSRIPHEHVLMRVALAMQMGGALGNLIDRILPMPVLQLGSPCCCLPFGMMSVKRKRDFEPQKPLSRTIQRLFKTAYHEINSLSIRSQIR